MEEFAPRTNWMVSVSEKIGGGKRRLRRYLVVATTASDAVDVLRETRDFASDVQDVGLAMGRVYEVTE